VTRQSPQKKIGDPLTQTPFRNDVTIVLSMIMKMIQKAKAKQKEEELTSQTIKILNEY